MDNLYLNLNNIDIIFENYLNHFDLKIEQKFYYIIHFEFFEYKLISISKIVFGLHYDKSKTLCYQFFHMILQDHSINKYKILFCSLHCLEIFEMKSLSKCAKYSKK